MAEFLNNNIKYLRAQKGMSQQTLADKIGIDRSTISRIENNETETTIDNAIKIAEVLDISLDMLVSKDLTVLENVKLDENHKLDKMILKGTSELTEESKKAIIGIMDNLEKKKPIESGEEKK